MPAKAGIQNYLKTLDSRLRGNDAKGRFNTFYETIKIEETLRSIFFYKKSTEYQNVSLF
jgi:hypothetical protein